MSDEQIRTQVRDGYAAIAARGPATSCCGTSPTRAVAQAIGYSDEELAHIPDEANLGLGCGNPTAIAALRPGEVVLDLGSGAGMDAFLAAARVGEQGRVIGVDMTPQMLRRARDTAAARGVSHYVEFREGLIEALPVVADSVDVVISNCVINLSPDKPRVFAEAFRVLKPGGRLAVSDICLSRPLPERVRALAESYVACIGGAMLADDYLAALAAAGFVDIEATRQSADALLDTACCDPTLQAGLSSVAPDDIEAVRGTLWSYRIEARKP